MTHRGESSNVIVHCCRGWRRALRAALHRCRGLSTSRLAFPAALLLRGLGPAVLSLVPPLFAEAALSLEGPGRRLPRRPRLSALVAFLAPFGLALLAFRLALALAIVHGTDVHRRKPLPLTGQPGQALCLAAASIAGPALKPISDELLHLLVVGAHVGRVGPQGVP